MDDSIYDIMVKLKFQSASQWFGPGSEVGFEKLLQIFDLPPQCSKTSTNQVRHTPGFGYSALPCQINLLFFM